MKKTLGKNEQTELLEILTRIKNDVQVIADRIDPDRDCVGKDGQRWRIARMLDAIYKMAKSAENELCPQSPK